MHAVWESREAKAWERLRVAVERGWEAGPSCAATLTSCTCVGEDAGCLGHLYMCVCMCVYVCVFVFV